MAMQNIYCTVGETVVCLSPPETPKKTCYQDDAGRRTGLPANPVGLGTALTGTAAGPREPPNAAAGQSF